MVMMTVVLRSGFLATLAMVEMMLTAVKASRPEVGSIQDGR
jgi:hypothetical protein